MSFPDKQKRVILALGDHYVERIHRGVADFARLHNWHLTNVFGNTPDLIKQRACNGFLTSLGNDDPLSEAIIDRRLPIVDLGIVRGELEIPHVTGDNVTIGRDAAHHFLERGFKNFVWYSESNHAMAEHRRMGFKEELQNSGFDCVDLILPNALGGDKLTWQKQKNWIQESIGSITKPCAVYAYNDLHAVNFIDACIAASIRIPNEVAVIGTDNHPLACPTAAVPLSSINHDLEELGHRAAYELEQIMNGNRSVRKIIEIPHKGISVRHSSDVFAINDSDVVNALSFIYANFHKNVSVSDIVDVTKLSRRALEDRFRKHLGKSILSTLNRHRLEEACSRLLHNNQSIADIAAITGFNTPEYFHRVFRQFMEMTPKSYRSSNKKK